MVKFAHLGDCHLGSWRQPELQELNFKSFEFAVDKCIKENCEFVLVAGDLFDSAYPPVEILKRAFGEFRKLKEKGIKCYMIAGSHDYSVSGKTFLDVLEKAGFCEMCKYEEIGEGDDKKINLLPIKHKTFEIFGYPGKKSGLEVDDLRRIHVPDSSNFRILMLHTSLKEAIGTIPVDSIPLESLPKAEYYALGHLHIDFRTKKDEKPVVYSGPIFPNNFQELEDLRAGSFYIVNVTGITEVTKIETRLKEVLIFGFDIKNALTATQQIITELEKHELEEKIILLRLQGTLTQGTNADIDYQKIKDYIDSKKAYSFLKNTHNLSASTEEIKTAASVLATDMGKIEEALIKDYEKRNPDRFNGLILPLMHSLNIEKQEDEKTGIYETRMFSEINKILNLDIK